MDPTRLTVKVQAWLSELAGSELSGTTNSASPSCSPPAKDENETLLLEASKSGCVLIVQCRRCFRLEQLCVACSGLAEVDEAQHEEHRRCAVIFVDADESGRSQARMRGRTGRGARQMNVWKLEGLEVLLDFLCEWELKRHGVDAQINAPEFTAVVSPTARSRSATVEWIRSNPCLTGSDREVSLSDQGTPSRESWETLTHEELSEEEARWKADNEDIWRERERWKERDAWLSGQTLGPKAVSTERAIIRERSWKQFKDQQIFAERCGVGERQAQCQAGPCSNLASHHHSEL